MGLIPEVFMTRQHVKWGQMMWRNEMHPHEINRWRCTHFKIAVSFYREGRGVEREREAKAQEDPEPVGPRRKKVFKDVDEQPPRYDHREPI